MYNNPKIQDQSPSWRPLNLDPSFFGEVSCDSEEMHRPLPTAGTAHIRFWDIPRDLFKFYWEPEALYKSIRLCYLSEPLVLSQVLGSWESIRGPKAALLWNTKLITELRV